MGLEEITIEFYQKNNKNYMNVCYTTHKLETINNSKLICKAEDTYLLKPEKHTITAEKGNHRPVHLDAIKSNILCESFAK